MKLNELDSDQLVTVTFSFLAQHMLYMQGLIKLWTAPEAICFLAPSQQIKSLGPKKCFSSFAVRTHKLRGDGSAVTSPTPDTLFFGGVAALRQESALALEMVLCPQQGVRAAEPRRTSQAHFLPLRAPCHRHHSCAGQRIFGKRIFFYSPRVVERVKSA
jgi:hypothetical protein